MFSNMIIKKRHKSISHRVLESLNNRMDLSLNEKRMYKNQVKGFQGEQAFDKIMLLNYPSGIVINDLLLSTGDTYYQIDSLLVTPHHLYLYEIKNYTGAYHYKDGVIYSKSGHALQDPVAQAKRKESYLYNLLLTLNLTVKISTFVVFIHPDFYIYNFPEIKSVLFEGQLSAHLKRLSKNTEAEEKQASRIAHKLISLHTDTYRPMNLPNNYTFDQLKKGILCPKCSSFAYTQTRETRTCATCSLKEKIPAAIHRSIEEFRLLFPDIRMNRNVISEWCGNALSKRRIQHVLKKHYTHKSSSRGSYYI